MGLEEKRKLKEIQEGKLKETLAAIKANPHITLVQTRHGGHCAFLATPDPASADDGRWAETTLLRFVLAHA